MKWPDKIDVFQIRKNLKVLVLFCGVALPGVALRGVAWRSVALSGVALRCVA